MHHVVPGTIKAYVSWLVKIILTMGDIRNPNCTYNTTFLRLMPKFSFSSMHKKEVPLDSLWIIHRLLIYLNEVTLPKVIENGKLLRITPRYKNPFGWKYTYCPHQDLPFNFIHILLPFLVGFWAAAYVFELFFLDIYTDRMLPCTICFEGPVGTIQKPLWVKV